LVKEKEVVLGHYLSACKDRFEEKGKFTSSIRLWVWSAPEEALQKTNRYIS
jgi:hypothetical protein